MPGPHRRRDRTGRVPCSPGKANGAGPAHGVAEGPWLQVPIVDADPASLTERMAMRVRFIRPGGEAMPAFAPML